MSREEERMIPVFTVLKNGAVLKNIFVINKPPDESNQETEEILIVGRHPDCNIVLMHPSISRFHLQINSIPFSKKLFLTDLSSVHGTLVSEKKIEPGYRVEVNEGDTIRLGGSTRVYRLHWLPLSSAYDTEKPFLSPTDLEVVKEEREEECGEHELNNFQDLNLASVENGESQSSDLFSKDISSMYPDENWESILDKVVQSVPFDDPHCIDTPCATNHVEVTGPCGINDEVGDTLRLRTDDDFVGEAMPGRENKDALMIQSEDESNDAVWFDSLLSSEDGEEHNHSPYHDSVRAMPQRESMDGLMMQSENKSNDEVCFDSSLFSEDAEVHAASEAPEEIVDKHNGVNNFPLEMESFEIPLSLEDHLETSKENEIMGPANISLPVWNVITQVTEIKESQTPQPGFSLIGNSEVRSENSSHDIWSRRGKPASGLKLQTSRSRGNTKAEFNNQGYTKDRSVTKALFSSSEEETFTPDKENCSPNTLLFKCLKKQSKLEEIQVSNAYYAPSPKHVFSPNIHLEENMAVSSDKENQSPKVLQPRKSGSRASKNRSILGQDMVLKEKRAERLPLQSLLSSSPGKSPSDFSAPTAATRSCLSVTCTQTVQKINSLGEAKRVWTMVADTSSLLDKESRKSLQLLQGLKGTQLIIPRMVIRELDCLNKRSSLFRRNTEASLALEWIEECMLNTARWIHVQSSMEEGEQTAPTPPASPHSHFTEATGGFPFWMTSSASFSPTSEDHIIDYALFNRRLYNNGQLVLVSNDISLKIKAMAEGLICETAQEFRKSLVNPFSERFLWADSSPRGQTWSVIDDVVLKDKYYRSPSKKLSKGESAKGLKLILRHNSQYGQNSWPVKTY